METIFFASDHAGFELKDILMGFVRDELGYKVEDCGAFSYDPEDDYTDFIVKAAREVSAHPLDARGIILGGSGQGEAMLANRFHDVRAAVYYGGPEEIVSLSRAHNDANILSLGARFLSEEEAKAAVRLWLATVHEPKEKYDRRIEEMEELSMEAEPSGRIIVPSLPAQSFGELTTLFQALHDVSPEMQVDIVDGVFVPHTSWPFSESDAAEALLKLAPYAEWFDIEMDCMCMYPESYLDLFAEIGVRRVVVHLGSTRAYGKCIEHAREHGYAISLALTNDSDLSELDIYAGEIDGIQVMGIESIGQQGQPFDERTLATVARIKAAYPDLPIAVDGGVNAETIPALLDAGVTRFAPGSAIAKSADPKASYTQLLRMIA